MGDFLSALGEKLAERWLTLLVLPGALYIAAVVAAPTLGHAHPLDASRLTHQIALWAKSPTVTTVSGQIILLAAILVSAAAAGLAAQALGRIMEILTLAADWRAWWPGWVSDIVGWCVKKRCERWDSANVAYQAARTAAADARVHGTLVDRAARDAAYRELARIAQIRPDRPTWSGDRIHSVSIRLRDELGLDLAWAWPSLWLTLEEQVRTEITSARTSLTRATTLAGWAVLYAPLTGWWWPAIVVTATLAVTAWRQTRTAADTYAQLIDAATRLHILDLAKQLDLPHNGPATPEIGSTITAHLTPP
ncbi:hypothetical protein ABZ281_16365 [Streptomyces sp. NPDC006265]|uniref:hypothetical protein n=1 Tax=Streptomyces sp. NPDC006265 TaxID=3156740 RepID=UPI0033BC3E5C